MDVRFISATNREPQEAVQQGILREDLFYRLRVVPIKLPPLRARVEDIPLLAEHFLGQELGAAPGCRVAGSGLRGRHGAFLQARPWRGNVRELQNVIEHVAVIVEPGGRSPRKTSRCTTMSRAFVIERCPDAMLNNRFHAAKDNLISHFEKEYLARLRRAPAETCRRRRDWPAIDRTHCTV